MQHTEPGRDGAIRKLPRYAMRGPLHRTSNAKTSVSIALANRSPDPTPVPLQHLFPEPLLRGRGRPKPVAQTSEHHSNTNATTYSTPKVTTDSSAEKRTSR